MGGGSETTVTIPGPTPQEQALQGAQLQLARTQLDEIRRQRELQEEFQAELGPLVEQQAAEAARAAERAEALFPVQEQLLAQELEAIERGAAATPEQQRLIGEVVSGQLAAGESDIEAFQERSLEQLREELAPSLGLRPGDAPLLDRGALLAAESARQQGQLTRDLRTAQARAELDFPLAVAEVESGRRQFQQTLAQRAQEFQQGLQQAAFANRLALSGQTGRFGLELAGIGTGFPAVPRGGTTTRTTTNTLGLVPLLGGAGGLLQGIGAVLPGP